VQLIVLSLGGHTAAEFENTSKKPKRMLAPNEQGEENPGERRFALSAMNMGGRSAEAEADLPMCRSLESLSLGGVAAVAPQTKLPRKYRIPKPGEISTYQGAGMVPVTRFPNGDVKILLYQPQKGSKMGVRWYDFGGKKEHRTEYTSYCACRKFAKQTYGVFGCNIEFSGIAPERVGPHLAELYHGLCNLPLMLKASQEWAQMQLLDDNPRLFYNDIHEYHTYLVRVPFVEADVLTQISKIVDGGKRTFKWLGNDDFKDEVLAPRLHMRSFTQQLEALNDDPWVKTTQKYGDGTIRRATGTFSAAEIKSSKRG